LRPLAFSALLVLLLSAHAGAGDAAPPPRHDAVVIYLHGRFVEDSGPDGVHPEHGPYRFHAIVRALSRKGVEVVADQRAPGSDVGAAAAHVVAVIQERLRRGVPAERIMVIGASKGAVIAALVSSRLDEPGVRYVLMAACNEWLEATHRPRLHGHVLSLFERSDPIGHSCRPIAAESPALSRFAEIELDTGLGHGFLYRPRRAWVEPALDWSRRRNE
jgi:acetyl esterase/lipase